MVMNGARERHRPSAGSIKVFLGPAKYEGFSKARLAAVPNTSDITKPLGERGAARQIEAALFHAVVDCRPRNLRTVDHRAIIAVRPISCIAVVRIDPSKHLFEREVRHDQARVLNVSMSL